MILRPNLSVLRRVCLTTVAWDSRKCRDKQIEVLPLVAFSLVQFIGRNRLISQ